MKNIVEVFNEYVSNYDLSIKEIAMKKVEHVVRKLAHFSIYTVIGFLLMSLMSTYKIKQKNRICISAIIGLLYAISDEIHQAFIPGRGPLVGDVLIDFSGVITGICIVSGLVYIYKKIT